MKRIILSIAILASACLFARADEGMWMLPYLQKYNAQAMAEAGCRISVDDIYSTDHVSLKDAIVQFGGGCTGEIISDRGLLITNHHCGYSYIQALSSPEHNYLEDGYFAQSLDEELPCEGLTVKFLQSMEDVTAKMAEQSAEEIVKAAREANPGCHVDLKGYYNNNTYYILVYKIYRDVRFVGAPPASIGKFGGNTDNWMWPRHTCDFSMFRVYSGPDGEPADYSEENIPYVPKKSLRISLKGVEDGDYTMVMGYPGSTQRFQTAAELEFMLESNATRVAARTVRQDIMWKAMREDPTVSLQYASKYARSTNYWKKWQGEELAFEHLNVIDKEVAKEAELQAWIEKCIRRNEKYGTAIADIAECTDANRETYLDAYLTMETLYNVEIASMYANFMAVYAKSVESLGAKGALEAAKGSLSRAYANYNAELDRKISAAMVEHFRANYKNELRPAIDGTPVDSLDVESYFDNVFANSVFVSAETLAAVDTIATIEADPIAGFYATTTETFSSLRAALGNEELMTKLSDAKKLYAAALLKFNGDKPSYPDANSTMRLSYGNVMSYSPQDGVLYKHYTTLKGVMDKEDPDNYEFRVPARLKEIYENGDFGEYTNKEGIVPTCFISNNDITGGNSGSPVLNADGDLIGLAFDGNWESMSSDVMFEPELQRCICVDIRYVLLMMDKFGGAGYLKDEMNIVR